MPTTVHAPRRPRWRRFAMLPAALLLGATALVSAGPALAATDGSAATTAESDAPTVRWSVTPATEDGPDGRISLRHVAEPGETVRDAVAVTNLGTDPATFSVTAGDGVLGANGAFDIATDEPVDSGAWIAVDGLDDATLTLDAGETRVLPVTVTVPAGATPGDHPAGIVVGVSSSDGLNSVTHRIGMRLHLQVAGELAPGLELSAVERTFTPSWIPFAQGTLRIDYEITNTGNVRLGAGSDVSVTGPFGLVPSGGTGRVDELLPGDSVTATVEVAAWPTFALFGDLVVGATAVGEDRVSLPAVTTHGVTGAAISWTGLAVLAALVGAVVLVVRRRRRRRAVAVPAAPPPVEAALNR